MPTFPHQDGYEKMRHVIFAIHIYQEHLPSLAVHYGLGFDGLGVLYLGINQYLRLVERKTCDMIGIKSMVLPVKWREHVVLEEIYIVDVGRHVREHCRQGVTSVWDGAQFQQTMILKPLVCGMTYLAIILTDEFSAGAMGYGKHGGHQHEGGVALDGMHLHLGVCIRVLGVQPSSVYFGRVGINKT